MSIACFMAAETAFSAASLSSDLTVSPAFPVKGNSFNLYYTVTNTGTSTATGVLASLIPVSGSVYASYISGPTPSGSVNLTQDSSQVFTWTYLAAGGGIVYFSASASGMDSGSGSTISTAHSESVTILEGEDGFTATLYSDKQYVCLGDTFKAFMTITNTGSMPLQMSGNVSCTTSSPPAPSLLSGPVPSMPFALSPGQSMTFTWTFDAPSLNLVILKATVSGLDLVTGETVSGVLLPQIIQIVQPGDLKAELTGPSTANIGQDFVVSFKVSNPASATVFSVIPLMSASSAVVSIKSGPYPASVAALGPAKSATFTWTCTGANSGTADLTATVTGLTCLLSTEISASATPISINILPGSPTAILASDLAIGPSSCVVGDFLTLVFTVTNGGTADAVDVTTEASPTVGSGLVNYLSGPIPAGSTTIFAGTSQMFTWTYSASGTGLVSFTATAIGTDAISGSVIIASDVASATVTMASSLLAKVIPSKLSVGVGENFVVAVSVSNTGTGPATNVRDSWYATSGTGTISYVAGPFPLSGVTLNPGQTSIFTWTLTGTSAGAVYFSTSATGTDSTSGLPIASPMAVSLSISVTPGFAVLSARLNSPASVQANEVFPVSMTVTNTGNLPLSNVIPRISTYPEITQISGPYPSAISYLAPGSSTTFVWSYKGDWSTTVRFTATALGYAEGSGTIYSNNSISYTNILSTTSAALTSTVSVSPAVPKVGELFMVYFTISNAGSADAIDMHPSIAVNSSLVTYPIAYNPDWILLHPQESWVLKWSFTATGDGKVLISTTATGINAANGALIWTWKDIVVTIEPATPPWQGVPGNHKIVGGAQGYVNPLLSESAVITVYPTGAGQVAIKIYDMTGSLLYEVYKDTSGNPESLAWDCKDSNGKRVPPGVYLVTIQAPGVSKKDRIAVLY